uniref:GOLD domain-containing protein n=1 Tax=Setaria digitata TaxID=48799 RepID=A0A915PUR6_9BILA
MAVRVVVEAVITADVDATVATATDDSHAVSAATATATAAHDNDDTTDGVDDDDVEIEDKDQRLQIILSTRYVATYMQHISSKQEALIKQLQEQHYQQYMAQIYAQQAKVAGASPDGEPIQANDNINGQGGTQDQVDHEGKRSRNQNSDVSDEEPGDDLPCKEASLHDRKCISLFGMNEEEGTNDNDDALCLQIQIQSTTANPAIAPASMWNRQDIVEFKNTIRKEGNESVIKVGHGETVTVRVPTHEEGSCLFWEFATDHYDIGFGVFFEWTVSETNRVSVHVSESSDEEAEEEFLQAQLRANDVESGSPVGEKQADPNKPHIDEIVPVYRRDCHEEVYAGSHVYPGRGVYLLKFDNSYSLWRSKTLYYRVYYSN